MLSNLGLAFLGRGRLQSVCGGRVSRGAKPSIIFPTVLADSARTALAPFAFAHNLSPLSELARFNGGEIGGGWTWSLPHGFVAPFNKRPSRSAVMSVKCGAASAGRLSRVTQMLPTLQDCKVIRTKLVMLLRNVSQLVGISARSLIPKDLRIAFQSREISRRSSANIVRGVQLRLALTVIGAP